MEVEEVKTVTVWLRGRWRGSECMFSVGAVGGGVVSRSSMAVMKVLWRPCFGNEGTVWRDVVAAT